MVCSVKYHQTVLSGAYVADTCKLRGWCLHYFSEYWIRV